MIEVMPVHDRVLVERIEPTSTYKGLIVIPESAQEKMQEGVVVAVGTGRVMESGQTAPLVLRVGHRVVFGKYSGSDVEIEGKKLLVLREEEVLLVLKEVVTPEEVNCKLAAALGEEKEEK